MGTITQGRDWQPMCRIVLGMGGILKGFIIARRLNRMISRREIETEKYIYFCKSEKLTTCLPQIALPTGEGIAFMYVFSVRRRKREQTR